MTMKPGIGEDLSQPRTEEKSRPVKAGEGWQGVPGAGQGCKSHILRAYCSPWCGCYKLHLQVPGQGLWWWSWEMILSHSGSQDWLVASTALYCFPSLSVTPPLFYPSSSPSSNPTSPLYLLTSHSCLYPSCCTPCPPPPFSLISSLSIQQTPLLPL